MNPTLSRQIHWSRLLRRYGTLIGFLLIVAVFWWQRPNTFMTIPNWLNITQQMSILGVVAFTMTVVMVAGDFDLSVGTLASLVGMVAGILFQSEQTIFVAVGLALVTGMAGGFLNGLLVSYAGISAFVATLGTLTIFGGLALYISGGNTIFGATIPEAFGEFGRRGLPLGTVGEQAISLPNLTMLAIIALVIVWVVLEQTVFGRRLYAVGGNREAARLAGLSVRSLRLSAFVVSGLGAAIAGLMLASRLATANPKQGEPLMLNAIAAVFLGMTMSEDGEPRVLGTLLGVLMIGVLANGLTQLQIDTYIQQILTGAIIVLAVLLSSLWRRT